MSKKDKWYREPCKSYGQGRYNYGPNVIIETENELWDSGWVTHEKPTLFISQAILGVCNAIQVKFPGLEFAILLKGEWTKYGFEISNTYAVPKQEVSAGFVRLDDGDVEKHKVNGFNVILHSHHNMGISFSGSDHDTLTDSSFSASILYSKNDIKEATISITVKEGVRVAVQPKIEVIGFLTELPDWIESVITRKPVTYTYGPDWKSKDVSNTKEWRKEVHGTGKFKVDDKTLIKDDCGDLFDSDGIFYVGTEEFAKLEGYEIITEDEYNKRKAKEEKEMDYDFGVCY